ncbi:MAG: phosphoribosylanthranilate isomerase [Rickettsiales bacterium]|jgi:phosphoribosylanthranilate isomerase|nr:phosphoribosylanthranilate isomerase [Rickettsiales bacterium]
MVDKPLNIKICGIKDIKTAKLIEDLGANFIGFVCYKKSPRNISLKQYCDISSALGSRINKVIVAVEPSDEFIEELITTARPDYLQIHGHITIDRINHIKAKYKLNLIIALSYLSLQQDLINELEQVSDYILIDSASQSGNGEYGGSGLKFNWTKLTKFKFNKPYFLSGGLNITNIKKALDLTLCNYVDLSSALESEKGVKSPKKITEFFNYLRANEYL